jgi:hypothetical protein
MTVPSSPPSPPSPRPADAEDRPPIFRQWSSFYLVLVGELALLIGLFWLLSWWAA